MLKLKFLQAEVSHNQPHKKSRDLLYIVSSYKFLINNTCLNVLTVHKDDVGLAYLPLYYITVTPLTCIAPLQ